MSIEFSGVFNAKEEIYGVDLDTLCFTVNGWLPFVRVLMQYNDVRPLQPEEFSHSTFTTRCNGRLKISLS